MGFQAMVNRALVFAFALTSVVVLSGCGEPAPAKVTANRANGNSLREHFNEDGVNAGSTVAALPDPTGFATLVGSFKIDGEPPELAPLVVSGNDASFCGSPLNEQLVIGEDGEIRDILIYLNTKIPQDNPLWEHESYTIDQGAVLSGNRIFDQKQCVFLSHVYAMRTGQTLQVVNSDSVGHNTNISGGPNFNLGVGATENYSPSKQTNQPVSIVCGVHPWMKANLLVRDNPYFAVTDSNGRFEIKNIPAGVELEFRVWQEKKGFLGNVSVSNGDGNFTQETWKKGRFKIALEPGQTVTRDVKINATEFN